MSIIRNHNYRIGTDELLDGRIKATARGRKTNVQTFPAGTTHEAAAETLAAKLEGDRFAEVRCLVSIMGRKADWAVFVTTDAAPAVTAPLGIDALAAQLIESALAAHGRCIIACDCGAWEMAIDADAIGNAADVAKARELIEHARYDHATPRTITATVAATVAATVFDTRSIVNA